MKLEEIKLQSGDWLWNASMLGFINIVGRENVNFNESENTISLSKDVLTDFQEKYFEYLIETYKLTLPWYRIISFEPKIRQMRANSYSEFTYDGLKSLNSYIDVAKKYIKSNSFISAFDLIGESERIIELGKKLTKIKEPKEAKYEESKADIVKDVDIQLGFIEEIIEYFKTEKAKKYVAAKNVMYTVIKNGWNGVSFLYRQTKFKDMYEDYNKSFVTPAREYIEADKEKYKLNCFVCGLPVKDANNNMSFLNKVGFDTNRKASHVWDFQNDTFICPLCRLIYSCLPAGMTYFSNSGIYLNAGMNLEYNYRLNNEIKGKVYDAGDNIGSSGIYKALIQTMNNEKVQRTEYEIADIQVVRYENETYSFNLIPRITSEYIKQNYNDISLLSNTWYKEGNDWYSVYNDVVKRIFNNQNLFSLIYKLLHYRIASPSNCRYNAYHVYKMVELNMKLLKIIGGIKMEYADKEKTIAEQAKNSGYYLRTAYDNRDKLPGISYRLLNALKTNNRSAFMDTLLNCYLYVGKEVPKIFVKSFEDDKVFQTIGYAFVSGLIDDKSKSKEDK